MAAVTLDRGRSGIAAVLRLVAKAFDRMRWPVRRVGAWLDSFDRALGGVCWRCRSKAYYIERGQVDDGIPF